MFLRFFGYASDTYVRLERRKWLWKTLLVINEIGVVVKVI